MRPLATLAALSLLLTATAGCAAPGATTSPFDLHGDEFEHVRGDYALADGHVARLGGTRRHPRLDIVDGATLALRPLSATEFVSDDGCARVVFELSANASAARMRIARAAACGSR